MSTDRNNRNSVGWVVRVARCDALLDRLPDLRLDPTAPYPSINGVAFRSQAALLVEFTPT